MARRRRCAMSREARNRRRKRRHVRQHRSHARPHRHAPKTLTRWTTALVASAALGAGWPTRVCAGTPPAPRQATTEVRPGQTSPAAGDQPVRRFDIAPGPLSAVLPAFARAAGITVTMSTESIGLITSPGVSGTFTMQEALAHL